MWQKSRPRTMRGVYSSSPVLLAIALVLLPIVPVGSSLAQTGCAQPLDSGCPLSLGQTVRVNLADPSHRHVWRFRVPSAGSFRVTLTDLPTDYDLYLRDASGIIVGQSANESTADEIIEFEGPEGGDFLIYVLVDPSRGDVDPTRP